MISCSVFGQFRPFRELPIGNSTIRRPGLLGRGHKGMDGTSMRGRWRVVVSLLVDGLQRDVGRGR
jgi:hypothetical protein